MFLLPVESLDRRQNHSASLGRKKEIVDSLRRSQTNRQQMDISRFVYIPCETESPQSFVKRLQFNVSTTAIKVAVVGR